MGWVSKKVEAGKWAVQSQTHLVEGRARDSGSNYNTCNMRVYQKDQVITLGVLTDWEKLHSSAYSVFP